MSVVIRLIAEVLPGLAALFRKTVRTKAVHAREVILQCLEELEDRRLAEERLGTPANRWSHEDLEADADLVRPGARHTAAARPPTHAS